MPDDALLDLPRCYETPAGVRLGPLDAVPDGGARGFVLRMKAARFHGFAVRRGDRLYGYVDRCPHAGLPLSQQLDRYLTADGSLILCGWHGALFQVESGACAGGPCMGAALTPWPLKVRDGIVLTA